MKTKKRSSPPKTQEELRHRLAEAEEALQAIRSGEVDAVMVGSSPNEHVYTLQGADEAYRILIEQMIEGAVTLSPQGVILYANRRFADMVKRPLQKILGTRMEHYIQPADCERFAAHVRQANSKSAREEFTLRAGDGIAPVQISASKAKMDPPVTILVVTDLTEQKRIQQELNGALSELESFSHAVSHDLRAPLRAINSFGSIILDDYGEKLDEDGKRYIENVITSGRLMGRLIDELLAFTRLSHQDLRFSPVNMTAVAHAVAEEQKKTEPQRSVEVSVGELPPALASDILIRQVWTNLISNALKFSRGKPKTVIEIGAESVNGNNRYYVRDNGAGFDMRYVQKLFGIFQRLHLESEYEGTGIGLALVKRIIERHGGTVSAEGALGHGATFSFTLPPLQEN